MKKYLSIAILAVLIIPSITFASWWNPFSWFKKNIKPVEQTAVQAPEVETQKTSEEKINELQKQVDELKNNQAVPKLVSPEIKKNIEVKKEEKTKIITDVCTNIEGVQSKVPEGYSSNSGICNLVVLKDFCPNIEGVQSVFPANMIFDKKLNKCFTEAELEELNKNKEKEAVYNLKKDELKDINDKILENRAKIEEIRKRIYGKGLTKDQASSSFYAETNALVSEYETLLLKSNILNQELYLMR